MRRSAAALIGGRNHRAAGTPGRTHSRRGFLAAGAAAASVPVLGSCSRLSGEIAKGSSDDRVIKWAQFYTTQSGAVAEENQRWLQQVITVFEDENPGWTVDLEGYQWDQLDQRLVLDLQADVPHDISLTSPQLMGRHAAAGSLLDLADRVDSWSAAERADFDWSPVWRSAEVGGQLLGIPLGVVTRGLAYRPGLVGEAPRTPDELLAGAARAPDDAPGLLMYLGADRAATEVSVAPMVWHFGGDLLDSRAREATLTSEPVVEAMLWLRSLVRGHRVTPAGAASPTAAYDGVVLNQFVNSSAPAAFGFGNVWIQALQQAELINGCFPASAKCRTGEASIAPVPTDGGAAFTNAWMVSIGAQSTKPDMCWRLIETMLRPEILRSYPDAGMPARTSEYERTEYSGAFFRTWRSMAENGRGMPVTPYYPQLSDTVTAAMQELVGEPGRLSAASARGVLARYNDEWNGEYGGR